MATETPFDYEGTTSVRRRQLAARKNRFQLIWSNKKIVFIALFASYVAILWNLHNQICEYHSLFVDSAVSSMAINKAF